MILKETIKKVLKEKVKKKILSFIGSHGLISAIEFFGGWDFIEDKLGKDENLRKIKIDFIKELTNKYSGLSFWDLNENPILFKQTNEEYQEITHLGLRNVVIEIWDEDWKQDGQFIVLYENLSDKNINDIFNMLMKHFKKGINL